MQQATWLNHNRLVAHACVLVSSPIMILLIYEGIVTSRLQKTHISASELQFKLAELVGNFLEQLQSWSRDQTCLTRAVQKRYSAVYLL